MIKSDIKIEYLKPEFQISDLDRDYQEYLKKWKKL